MVFPSLAKWIKRSATTTADGPQRSGRRHAWQFHPALVQLEERSLPSFLLSGSFDTGGKVPFATVVGDFNGDGIPDVAVANSNFGTGSNGSVSVLLGNGDGTFQAPVTFATTAPDARVLVAADFNGDGNLDLAVANRDSSVNVFLGNGDGTFQAPLTYGTGLSPHALATADFNGDGIPDLLWPNFNTNTVSVLLGNGDGTFQAPMNFKVGAAPRFVVAADFNGDGVPDVAVANQNSAEVSILLGNGDGTFQDAVNDAVGQTPYAMVAGDFNNDGALDLVVANYVDNTISVLVNNGDGTFQPSAYYDGGTTPASLAAADFNGDGNLDLAIASYDTWATRLGNGDATFQPPVTNDDIEGPSWVTVGDFNGDGLPDLAVTSGEDATVTIYLNQPDNTATGLAQFRTPSERAQAALVTIPVTRTDGFDGVVGVPFAASDGIAPAKQDSSADHQTEPNENVVRTPSSPPAAATLGKPHAAEFPSLDNDLTPSPVTAFLPGTNGFSA
jgi:hypothetical protein